MDYTNDPDGTKYQQLDNRHPNLHDYELLAEKYAHLNGTTSGGEESGGGGKGNNGGGRGKKNKAPGMDISDWGKATGSDGNGRSNQFELTLGNGDKVITHVLWANSDSQINKQNKKGPPSIGGPFLIAVRSRRYRFTAAAWRVFPLDEGNAPASARSSPLK